MVKNLPLRQETRVQSLGWEVPLEKGMAIHSSILAWRIPWTEEPGRLYRLWGHRESDTTEWLTHTVNDMHHAATLWQARSVMLASRRTAWTLLRKPQIRQGRQAVNKPSHLPSRPKHWEAARLPPLPRSHGRGFLPLHSNSVKALLTLLVTPVNLESTAVLCCAVLCCAVLSRSVVSNSLRPHGL